MEHGIKWKRCLMYINILYDLSTRNRERPEVENLACVNVRVADVVYLFWRCKCTRGYTQIRNIQNIIIVKSSVFLFLRLLGHLHQTLTEKHYSVFSYVVGEVNNQLLFFGKMLLLNFVLSTFLLNLKEEKQRKRSQPNIIFEFSSIKRRKWYI